MAKELHPLLRRAILYLEEQDWGSADDYCERYLDEEPENAYAYVIKLMARMHISKEEDLGKGICSYRNWNSYENAYRFADQDLKQRLEGYIESVEENIRQVELQRIREEKELEERRIEQIRLAEEAKKEEIYNKASHYQESSYYDSIITAISMFNEISDYKDSLERAQMCREKASNIKAVEIQKKELALKKERKLKRKIALVIICSLLLIIILIASLVTYNAWVNAEKNHGYMKEQIKKGLTNTTFTDTYTDYISPTENDVSFLVSEMKEYTITYDFAEDNSITINITEKYDKEPFLKENGEQLWDDVKHYTKSGKWEDIEISLFNQDVTITIDGKKCPVSIDYRNHPMCIKIDEKSYLRDYEYFE